MIYLFNFTIKPKNGPTDYPWITVDKYQDSRRFISRTVDLSEKFIQFFSLGNLVHEDSYHFLINCPHLTNERSQFQEKLSQLHSSVPEHWRPCITILENLPELDQFKLLLCSFTDLSLSNIVGFNFWFPPI